MKTIVVKTQAELDALPLSFTEYTQIRIESPKGVWISVSKTRENSSVEAWENSSVVAWGNSSVVAWGNSSVEACGNSSVEAWGNSSVEAWENSSVEAWENSSVVARGNSSVVAWGNSSVEAWENSSVEAWGNSSVEAWENSTLELFISAYVIVLSSKVIIKKLLDYSTAVFKGVKENIQEKSDTALVREIPGEINPSFDEWLSRGYVHADGISKKLKSKKQIGEIEVFEAYEFPKTKTSFVVKRGETFSHGETVEKAIEDLRYKISDRDTSKFNQWKTDLDQVVSLDDAIKAYRIITGACEMGTKQFVNSIQVPEKLTPRSIIEITKGNFGSDKFKDFLGINQEEITL